jgi:hypothetical protein
MIMSIDAKTILERLSKAENKKKYTLTLTPSLMEAFQTECEKQGYGYSPVIEELIKEFLESSKKKK